MSHSELTALGELLAPLAVDARAWALAGLLLAAALVDCRERRIPNRLVLGGVAIALLLHVAIDRTLLPALAGMALGFALYVPLYLVRAMGAGDVKLLAMVGAFVGPLAVFHVALASIAAAGALSIVYIVARGTVTTMIRNLSAMARGALLDAAGGSVPRLRIPAAASAGRLPFAVAIAFATAAYLVTRQLGLLRDLGALPL